MNIWRTLLPLIFCFAFSQNAVATITLKDVTGAYGAKVLSTTPYIYWSQVGTACTQSSTETCNSCSGATFGEACSLRYASAASYFYLTIESTTAGTITVTNNEGNDITTYPPGVTVAEKGQATIKLQWSDLQTQVFSLSKSTILVKVAGTDSLTINVQKITTGANKTDCTTNPFGVCDFSLFPGDQKTYLDLGKVDGYPARTGETPFAGVRIYYKEIPVTETTGSPAACPPLNSASACTIASGFAYTDSYRDLTISTDFSYDNTILDLENDKHYCFAIVNRDIGENLGYRVYIDGSSAKCVSASPSEVIGLLTKQANCFIATAAYGSALDPKIQVFRDFRDQFLIPSKLGRKFVKWYYRVGSEWGKKIENNEPARFAVRLALWPLWLFASALLNGYGLLLLSLLILAAAFFKFRRRFQLLSVLFLLVFSGYSSQGQTEENTPPREVPYIAPDEEAPQATDEVQIREVPLAPGNKPEPLPNYEEPRQKAVIEKNIETEAQELKEESHKINRLEAELKRRQELQRRRRLGIGAKSEKILNMEAQERLKKNPPTLSRITGEVQYPRTQSPQKYGASFRIGKYSPGNLRNSDPALNSTLYFDEVYRESSDLIFLFDFEYQLFKNLGKLGIKGGTGIFTASGKGRFKNNSRTEARESFTFLMLPNTLGGVYRLQVWEKQPLVPFAEAGAGYFTFVEVRDDFKRTKYGGAPMAYWAVGASFLLDYVSPRTMGELDSDYGINHMWVTAEFRDYISLGGNLDFSNEAITAGIFFEF